MLCCFLCRRLLLLYFFFSSRRRHTICALVTVVQTCALPILLPGLGSTLIACLGPLDLERTVRRPHHAGDLNRHGPFADIGERIGAARIVAEELAAALGREIIGFEPDRKSTRLNSSH